MSSGESVVKASSGDPLDRIFNPVTVWNNTDRKAIFVKVMYEVMTRVVLCACFA